MKNIRLGAAEVFVDPVVEVRMSGRLAYNQFRLDFKYKSGEVLSEFITGWSKAFKRAKEIAAGDAEFYEKGRLC